MQPGSMQAGEVPGMSQREQTQGVIIGGYYRAVIRGGGGGEWRRD